MKSLAISDFSFAYPDGEELLSHLSLELDEGSFTLLVGDTGSGKTTLLRSIKPELAPTGNRSGDIAVFGRETHELDPFASSELIGYVSQSPENQIVCDSVWHELAFGLENLGVAPDAMRRRVAETAYFFDIESLMRTQTASLSGGQKQAVTLASVFVMQPKLLLLDEPTGQLDPIAEKNFLHALFRINRELGITVVVATHAPEVMAAYAHRALRLVNGGIEDSDLADFDYAARLKATDKGPSTTDETVSEAQFFAPSPLKSSDAVISLHDVFFRYTQDAPWVLRGFDLDIAPGSIHALVGGNGSGKSTVLQMIAGSLKAARGKVRNKLSDIQAYLPQNPKALFVCDSVDEELREWQQRCGYTDDERAETVRFFGLEALLSQHPYDLSGGQQQKLALAKLTLTKPKLLLLDEATKGLDPTSKCEIAELLLQLRDRGVTMVFATHDLSFASQICDKATMIFDGEATCTEPISEFFARNIFYRPLADGFALTWKNRQAASAREDDPS